jgi:Zinc dependent phospholipase C
MPTPTEAPSFRISATTRSAAPNSAAWSTTSAEGISSASCCSKVEINEYAFALGALSHYAADIAGHPAVNQAVAVEYPKLRKKFGKSVRYAQDKTAHLKSEFGFDTLQVAKNRYASEQYHNFIGFQVSKSWLERVFPVVYGVKLKDVLTDEDLAVGSYRFSVGRLIPQMTQVALQTHKKNLMHETPNFAKRKFRYRLSRSDYEKEWGKTA